MTDWFAFLVAWRRSAAVKMSESSQKSLRSLLSRLRKKVRRCERLKVEVEELSDEYEKRLDKKKRRILHLNETMVEDLEEAQREIKLSERASEALGAEHEAQEIAIEYLQTSYRKHIDRNEADIAEQGRRQALASPPPQGRNGWE